LKTTLDVPDPLWNKFEHTALDREGRGGKRNAIMCKLIQGYIDGKFPVKA
jgi:hypothetical protein